MAATKDLRPQVALSGRTDWVVRRLMRLRGEDAPDVLRWIVDRWIDGEGREFLRSYEIDLLDFPNQDVVSIATQDSRRRRDGS